jgi:hypothetical protein
MPTYTPYTGDYSTFGEDPGGWHFFLDAVNPNTPVPGSPSPSTTPPGRGGVLGGDDPGTQYLNTLFGRGGSGGSSFGAGRAGVGQQEANRMSAGFAPASFGNIARAIGNAFGVTTGTLSPAGLLGLGMQATGIKTGLPGMGIKSMVGWSGYDADLQAAVDAGRMYESEAQREQGMRNVARSAQNAIASGVGMHVGHPSGAISDGGGGGGPFGGGGGDAFGRASEHGPAGEAGGPRSGMAARGGLVRGGALSGHARRVAAAGEGGDSELVHMNKGELDALAAKWGEPDVNPHTGLPSFNIFKKLKNIIPFVAPAVSAALPGLGAYVGDALGIGSTWGGALTSGVLGTALGALSGGAKGALTSGLLGAGAGALMPQLLPGNPNQPFAPFGGTAGALGTVPLAPHGGAGAGPNPAAALAATAASPSGGGASKAAGQSTMSLVMPALLGLGALGALGGGGGKETKGGTPTPPKGFSDPLQTLPFDQKAIDLNPDTDWYTIGEHPNDIASGQGMFFQHPVGFYQDGGAVDGDGDGQSDDVPAMLSDGEYVVPADVVSNLGSGSNDAGAGHLDRMVKNVRRHRGRAMARGKFPPAAKGALDYMRSAA